MRDKPIMSEREMRKAIAAAKAEGWKLHSDGPPDYEILGLHPGIHQPDDDPVPLSEILKTMKPNSL